MKSLVLHLILIVFSFQLVGQETPSEWNFRKEENGIKTWTKKVTDSKFEAYKVETITEGSLAACVGIFHDVNAYDQLFDDSKDNQLVEKINDAHIITYVHTNLPFPVKDRDGYYENKFEYLADEEKVRVNFSCIDGYERKKRVIRLTYCTGHWEFKKIDDKRIKITHIFHTDPQGAIPAWIVNKKTVDSPIHTLSAFKRLLKNPDYAEQSFDFMK